ncbi:MAG: pseudouridine synthase, partial [Oscillospiraceae bacterium]
MEQRLDKLVSVAMGLSRTAAKKLIVQGAVTVDGKTVRQPDGKADPAAQEICAHGRLLCYRDKLYLLMNKPLGVVSSTDDPDSPTVLELLSPALRRKGLFPAGRLDKYSEGMLIITDDGVFAHRLLAPRRRVPKTYYVELDAPIVNEALAA